MESVKKEWVYFGGRTSQLVADELGGRVYPYNEVGEFITEHTKGVDGTKYEGVRGVIVTDMSLQTIMNWGEIEVLARLLKDREVRVVTCRKIREGFELPVNVHVKNVDVVRLEEVEGILRGGKR